MPAFSEDQIDETRRRGRIEVICGSMFSGKLMFDIRMWMSFRTIAIQSLQRR